MKYTIYQITNTLNGKIYIGKHQTEDIHDGYFGSGVALRNAITKYGKENFVKEILFVFNSDEEMNAKERELITEEFVNRSDTYNLGVGGEGGPHFKGKTHTVESRRTISDETRRKISVAAKERCQLRKKIENPAKTTQQYIPTAEHKRKISDTLKSKGLVSANTTERTVCPYCKKDGQLLAMKRHHFKNCKSLRISEPVSR